MRAGLQTTLAALALLLGGCSTVPLEVPHPPSHAIDSSAETFLGRTFAASLATSPGASGFHLLVTGEEAFVARAALAQSAERSLDLQYYAVADDATATMLLSQALRAAQRGVRVRVLLDDLYAVGRDAALARLAAQPNVEVRVFNPFLQRGGFALTRLFEALVDGRLNARMHNKVWIADNAAAVVGGRNLGDHYFAAHADGDFADLDVLAAGPIVAGISASFDAYWNDDAAVPIAALAEEAPGSEDIEATARQMAASAERFRDTDYARHLRTLDLGRTFRSGQLALDAASAVVLFDPPEKARLPASEPPGPILAALRPYVDAATQEMILVTPYFVPSDRGVEVLCGVSVRGVRVRVLTNSLATTDVPAVHAGYASYRRRLLACGVELHELRRQKGEAFAPRVGFSSGASLHAKAVVIDRHVVLVGSMNLDPRSRLINTETGLLIESAVVGERVGALFDAATALDQAFRLRLATPGDPDSALLWDGREGEHLITLQREPLASWWRRLLAGALGVLVPQAAL
jgi:putative cardiolipin synthase